MLHYIDQYSSGAAVLPPPGSEPARRYLAPALPADAHVRQDW